MSLPLPWVDRIFDKMTLTYGQHFLNRWRDLDLNAVKSDWMYELSGFEKAPHAIAFGLSNLPETAPFAPVQQQRQSSPASSPFYCGPSASALQVCLYQCS